MTKLRSLFFMIYDKLMVIYPPIGWVFRFGISLASVKNIFHRWRNFDVAFIPPLT